MGEPAAKRPRTASGAEEDAGHFVEHFTDPKIDNLRIEEIKAMVYPQLLIEEYPLTEKESATVEKAREEANRIVCGDDDRLIVIVGPCSIHDPKSALDYAQRLAAEAPRLKGELLIIMRVYFEKPRTTVGWKGLINDPMLDESYRVNQGLRTGRKLLQDINHLGLPCGCEFLDTMTPQYIADMVSWAAIGARTTECQLHRELASGLSFPVGFKNATSGDTDVVNDAIQAAAHPHCFFSITKQGTAAIVHSKGNPYTHAVLRGGKTGPNFSEKDVQECIAKQAKKGLKQGIMIDCSHGNSQKNHKNQPKVAKDICAQLAQGANIIGVMIESHLFEGKQDLPSKEQVEKIHQNGQGGRGSPTREYVGVATDSPLLHLLRYGVSITDACVDWLTTVDMLSELAKGVRERRAAGGIKR